MTRAIFLFNEGTAIVGGVEVDAIGCHEHLPFFSHKARVAAAKAELRNDDWEAAKAISDRRVLEAGEQSVQVRFVVPPDWERFGEAVWNAETGTAHAVFQSSTMLVEGVAVKDCVGLRFEDEIARRLCALWCVANGLSDHARRVVNTPIGGAPPHCTWPDNGSNFESTDAKALQAPDHSSRDCRSAEIHSTEPGSHGIERATDVIHLFGHVVSADDEDSLGH